MTPPKFSKPSVPLPGSATPSQGASEDAAEMEPGAGDVPPLPFEPGWGYCVRCKKRSQMQDPKPVVMKNGLSAWSGPCKNCGTKVFQLGGASS